MFRTARIIFTIIVREMATRFGSKPGGYIWAFLDPAAHIFMMTAIFSAIARVPPIGTRFVIFFASGYLAMQFYTTIQAQIAQSVNANRNLLTYPVLVPFDFVIARLVLQYLTVVILATVILIATFWATGEDGRVLLAPMLEASIVAAGIALGVGMMNVVLFKAWPIYEKAFQIASRPMFLISGVMILIEDLPSPYREWLLWNPIAHIVMWFRTGIYPYYRTDALDREYAVLFAMVSIMIGFSIFTASKAGMRRA